eukprot:747436-Hanusia_phi.AAC.2
MMNHRRQDLLPQAIHPNPNQNGPLQSSSSSSGARLVHARALGNCLASSVTYIPELCGIGLMFRPDAQGLVRICGIQPDGPGCPPAAARLV